MRKTRLNTVKRVPKRARYDFETLSAILDASFTCHVAFVYENHPVVIPTIYGRKEDRIYFHGAASSRMLKVIGEGNKVSIGVTLVDGIVLARSAFHHSINYRSVVLFGQALQITDQSEKLNALKIISDQVAPDRWEEVRPPNTKELKATSVYFISIDESSAKVRTGPPVDDKEDYKLNVWAGVVPLKVVAGMPIRDDLLQEGVKLSDSIKHIRGKYS